ncbi:MAG: flagellar biosynthesis protein FlhF [Pirellulales bacterium]|nr:flagellar biosynthesis protein FlhF [Pirellulales bacterium]
MELHTYRAKSMQEALSLVRRELGPDAAVLHTREVQLRRFFGCLRGPTQIEITAGRGVNVPSRLPLDDQENFMPPGEDDSPTYGRPRPATPASLLRSTRERPDNTPAVQEQISDLQAMVKELCKRSKGTGAGELPEELFHLFTSLIDADVSEELARELVDRLRHEVRGGELRDPLMLQARIARMIEADIRAAGPIALAPGKCRVAALVGPTGVGKTTTIAKLAANFHLKEKRRVGLITVDTYRIAAVEQLRTYADIIDLPMEVVSTPKEMRQAVGRMSDMDLVLIDTAGRSPKDEVRLQELKAFLTEAGTDEVHLVLSSVAAWRTLEQTAARFATVGTTALILTKLDEANGLGNVLPVLRSSRLPLSYLTDGQNVPDDIGIADSAHLAKLVLGMEGAEV